MADVVLEVKGLTKSFRRGFVPRSVNVLKDVSFSLRRGTITGFLGANGAGKTTTIKCLLNLIFPDAGEITFFGKEKISKEVLSRIGFLPERPYFYSYLSGFEFLTFYGSLSGVFKSKKELRERTHLLLKRVGLEASASKRLKDYSKGMLQRIGVAQALIHRPQLIILDEPKSGLDPDGRLELSRIIRETANEGTSVFFSSHLLPDAEKLCENLVIIKQGKIAYEGKTTKLLQHSQGSTIYFLDGSETKTLSVADSGALQISLEKLLKEKKIITEVRRESLTLEEAFVRMVL